MNDIIDAALEAAASAGASYADVRVVDTSREEIQVASRRRRGASSAPTASASACACIADGAWGFASSRDVTAAEAERVARAGGRDRAGSAHSSPARRSMLAPVEPARGVWAGPCAIDPFTVPLEDKLALLIAADEALRDAARGHASPRRTCGFYRERKWFGSTEGAFTEQSWVESGAGIAAYAIGGRRGRHPLLPQLARRRLGAGRLGVHRPASTSSATRRASPSRPPRCSPRPTSSPATCDLIIDGSQLALQVHESIGHPTELDRVLGEEAAFAGTSFLTLDDVGSLQLRLASIVTVTADATVPGSLGSFGWDDEGVPAQRDYLIKDGHPRQASSRRARPRPRSGARATAACAPTAGTASRSSA